MLIELAYRLIVEETPFIQNIRNNVITLITPVIEVDGREKQVDTYYFNKKRAQGDARLPLMYWGKYVQHDNNRDGMGQFLEAHAGGDEGRTLEWHPTVIHDLHEAQTYLYSSTGTGPYNNDIDPIAVSEWWMLAQNDVMEMTKRGVPGVWTYGFYDGWVPNYMFFIAHSHNSIGRFYEVQSYGPDPYEVRPGATTHEQGVVPAEPAAAVDQVGAAQQHQHPAVGAAVLAQPRREEQGALSRELLAEEQARGGQGQDRPDLRVGDSRRRSAARPTPPRRSTSCARQGLEVSTAGSGVQGRQRRRQGRRLHRPRRSAVPHARRHVLLDPELRAAESVAVRRHRLDVPVHARPQDPAGDRQERPRSADDAADGGCEGAGRH